MSPRRVGILGGMGPEATVLLMRRLIAAVPVTDDAGHIPLIVDMNPQVPSRIAHLIEGTGEDPGPVLAAMARRLEVAGAEALAMPCNTAHAYAPTIRAAVEVPLIDMVALCAARVRAQAGPGAVVGILASPAVQRIGLFERIFEAEHLRPIYPRDTDAMLAAIRAIKAEGVSPKARATVAAASEELVHEGALVQVIACTEFSLLSDVLAEGPTVLDTLDVLVDGIVAFAVAGTAGGSPAG